MLQLLKQIESISSCRDRDTLGANVLTAVNELLRPRQASLLRLIPTPSGPAIARVAQVGGDGLRLFAEEGAAITPIDTRPLLRQAYSESEPAAEMGEAGFRWAYPLASCPSSTPTGFLHLEMDQPPTPDEREAVEHFLHFYCNYIGLLDYSELDTLTGLLNRKTFDEAFDKMLAQSGSGGEADAAPAMERRCGCPEACLHWLAVVDIDHFKRVNDTFGHLFGDEVLLRVANLMRGAFRSQDRLFRFGGEEFVVMLRTGDQADATRALERLRQVVEGHEFPQVGQVTCSIGFTAVDPLLAPTDILGQADEALYYAKEHGRNQVCCYEALIAEGFLSRHEAEAAQPEFDIDALFG